MWQQPAPLFRTLTLGQRFAAVSAGLAGLAILVIGLTAWTLASQELERHHRSSLRQEGSLVAERVGGQLRAMAASMEALSRNSLLANALVDTFGKETYLLPFLSSVRQVDGIPVDILFADFEGNPIATNGTTPFGPDEMAWLTATIGGGRSRAEVRDGPEGPMVLAAELMFYSRTPTPEGALMYRFPLSSLMGHGAARLVSGGGPASPMRHPVEAGGVLVQPGFMVEVSDADSPSPSLQKVALVFALAAVVAMGLIVVLSGAAGRRLTTELRSLRDFANAVVSEGFSERRLAVHGGDEVAEVASAVNYMVNRLSELHAAEQNEARHKLDVERDKLLAAQRIGRLGNWDYHYDTDEITCSDEVFRITGLDKGETGSVPLPQLLSLLASEDQAKVLRALAHPKTGTTLELRLQRSGAPARHLSVTFGETEFLAGEPASVGGVLQDVTDAREAERRLAEKTRELEKVNADLQAFAYVASHDLRQPLRMVTSYLTLLERSLGPGLADEPAQFVAYARDGATRMDRLIVDLLEYSRSGRADHGEDVDLGAAAAEALTNLKWNLEEAGASVELAPDAPVVHGNAGELTRLFQNLVGNAIKYRSPERPPRIAIGWRRNGDEVMVQVEDNGIGIPPEHADRVFGIFQRLHTTQEYEGSGIGLAICKKVVESHGGRIWLASEPDRGTTFFAAFPTA